MLLPVRRAVDDEGLAERLHLVEHVGRKAGNAHFDRHRGRDRASPGNGRRRFEPLRHRGGVDVVGDQLAAELERRALAEMLLQARERGTVPEREKPEQSGGGPASLDLDVAIPELRDDRHKSFARCSVARVDVGGHFRSESRKVLSVATWSAVAASASMTTYALSCA